MMLMPWPSFTASRQGMSLAISAISRYPNRRMAAFFLGAQDNLRGGYST
jgi:hypothetical protein